MGILAVLRREEPGPLRKMLNSREAGQFGEYSIEYALKNSVRGESSILRNLYVRTGHGTTEIDLIMIHEKGIFVIESKDYSGRIYGKEGDIYWTQIMRSGGRYRFYDPVRQNRTHIRALSRHLHMPVSAFTSCIVFSDRCRIIKAPEDDEHLMIVRRRKLIRALRSRLRRSEVIYTSGDIHDMRAALLPLTGMSWSSRQKHIKRLRSECPLCGRPLVEKNGRHGPFLGCSGYPLCRFTRQM